VNRIERRRPGPKEIFTTFDFSQFWPEKIKKFLSNWDAQEVEANRKWVFVHKKLDGYYFEVYKARFPSKATKDENRVILAIDNPLAHLLITFNDSRSFSIGTSGRVRALRFHGVYGRNLEIDNFGNFKSTGLNAELKFHKKNPTKVG
jgi:hypothetical protein